MNQNAMSQTSQRLSGERLESFGREIEQVYQDARASLGESDRRYIKRVIFAQRLLALVSRVVLFASIFALPLAQRWHVFHALAPIARWPVFFSVFAIGTLGLAVAKILENMEIAHNVMHGQWDWMNDPAISSQTWEWDNVCPSDQWKHSHNFLHHTWTNVLGRDRDVGYEILRITKEQRWHPAYLLQPFYHLVLMSLFEWGIALHDIDLTGLRRGKVSVQEVMPNLKGVSKKAARQILKDFVLWPLLAGPFFYVVLAGNLMANWIRNVWSYMIIVCGHFPDGVSVFTENEVENETRAGFFQRQIMGSCNIDGGSVFHLMSGNLSYQIEHHLFPDLPSNRYKEVAPLVREIAARYGVPYNSGSLFRQFGSTNFKILKFALPANS